MTTLRDIRRGLAACSPLDRARATRGNPPCKLCGQLSRGFDLVDANKATMPDCFTFGLSGVGVAYLRCDGCGFVFTADFDDWPAADFAAHIYNDDYALVDAEYAAIRPAQLARVTAGLLGDRHGLRLLDYGSGGGVFVDRMRESGFTDTHGYDPFSSPQRPEGVFDVVTCFEVVEHSPDPVGTFREIAGFLVPGGVALVQTGLQPADIGTIRGSWWYIAPRNGHISIFNAQALSVVAQQSGLAMMLGAHQRVLFHDRRAAPDAALLAALAGGPVSLYRFVPLLAPAPERGSTAPVPCLTPDAWHGTETARDSSRFRWSREERLSWEVDIDAETTLELVPEIRMAVTPEHLAGLRLTVDGAEASLKRYGPRLSATVTVQPTGAPIRIELHTPPAVTPASLGRNADARPMTVALGTTAAPGGPGSS